MLTLTRWCMLLVVAAGLVLTLSPLRPGAGKAKQDEERKVDLDRRGGEPIEIVGLKNKKGKFAGPRIKAGDEWLENFTLTVFNRSDKTVDSLVIDLVFPRPANHKRSKDLPYVYIFHFNTNPFFPEYALRDRSKVIRPGESFDLVLSDEDYLQIKEYLRQLEYPASIKRVEVIVNTVGFEDGTVWGGGFFKRDPDNPDKFIKEEQPVGREHTRPAKFLARKSFEPVLLSFAKASWAAPAPAQFPGVCGRRSTPLREWCDKQFPEGQPLTCSKQFETLNTNTTDKRDELYNGLMGCLKWDAARSLWVSCGALEAAARVRSCSLTNECDQPPGGAPPLDRQCPEPVFACRFNEVWDPEWCMCVCASATPILLDTLGDGFRLTDAAGGVRFDLGADGAAERLSWTEAGSDDAWLALDRDGDGRIGDGRELFGNFTPQPDPPPGEARNGFLALAEFDRAENGGNADGRIDASDAVFASLRLWQDANHDGVSQPAELHPLASLDVVRLHLDYKESKRTDEHGNQFKYRAKAEDARGAKANRWAWDVVLVTGP